MTNRYLRLLEESPDLQHEVREAAAQDLSLRGEVALARTLLAQVAKALAKVHGSTGVLTAELFDLMNRQLAAVTGIVSSAAQIEAKKTDQRLDAGRLLVLLAGLRDDLVRSLAATHPGAEVVVRRCFERAKWTGEMTEERVQEALLAPAAYDVRFRRIDRDKDGHVKESEVARPLPPTRELRAKAEAVEIAEAEVARRTVTAVDEDLGTAVEAPPTEVDE